MKFKKKLKRFFYKLGYDISRKDAGLGQGTLTNELLKILNEIEVDLVLDIGANTGQFGKSLFDYGYNKQLLSFEPISHIYDQLKLNSAHINNWYVYDRCCVGDIEKQTTINISNLAGNSSVLPIKSTKFNVSQSHYIKQEKVNQITLSSLNGHPLVKDSKSIFIKMDIQGFEHAVLKAISETTYNIVGFFLELSLYKLYENQEDYLFICNYLKTYGYDLVYVSPESIRSNRMIQVNGIFLKNSLSFKVD